MLHHVGMLWMISSNQEMEYEMNTKINHLDWLNKGPWYNINICSKLHGIKFEGFITQARTDRYNIMIGRNQIIKTMKAVLVVEQYQMMQQ